MRNPGENSRKRKRGHTMAAPHAHPERMPRLVARRKQRAKAPEPDLSTGWQGNRHAFAALEASLPDDGLGFTRRVVGNAVVYNSDIEVFGVTRRIAIVFRSARDLLSPIVMSSGPTRSPHRYRWSRPTSLCMWHPSENPSRKWSFSTGLLGLLGIVKEHLSEEAMFRAEGRWFTDEHRHRPRREDSERVGRRADGAHRRTPKRRRHACWCGSGNRYEKCHGAIDEARERDVLGLTGPLRGDFV